MIIPLYLKNLFRAAFARAGASALLLLLVLPSISSASSTQPAGPKILILGDSISAAYGMSLEQGWVAQLQTRLQKEWPNLKMINASISGETTGGGLARLPALLQTHAPKVVIIELGANDGLRGYPLKRLRDNLENMVTLSQNSGARVVLLPMEVPPNYGTRYTTGFRQSFINIAKSTNSALSPFLLDGVATNSELMQPDGLHPTAEAQRIIAKNVEPTLRTELAKL